jgi:hypothetical protein
MAHHWLIGDEPIHRLPVHTPQHRGAVAPRLAVAELLEMNSIHSRSNVIPNLGPLLGWQTKLQVLKKAHRGVVTRSERRPLDPFSSDKSRCGRLLTIWIRARCTHNATHNHTSYDT